MTSSRPKKPRAKVRRIKAWAVRRGRDVRAYSSHALAASMVCSGVDVLGPCVITFTEPRRKHGK